MPDQEPSTISIHLNGEPYAIEGDTRLTLLLAKLKVQRGRIAVELNREVVPKAQYANVRLKEGDRLEVINFVGGG